MPSHVSRGIIGPRHLYICAAVDVRAQSNYIERTNPPPRRRLSKPQVSISIVSNALLFIVFSSLSYATPQLGSSVCSTYTFVVWPAMCSYGNQLLAALPRRA